MRPAHDDLYSSFSKCVSELICASDHPRHRPNAYKLDILVTTKPDKFGSRHRLRVSVYQHHLMSCGRQGL
jgi:hypothetical protein